MKRYFAYIRVSTVKQGQQGSSLLEQKDAIAAFAQRHQLTISEWFEDRETAAKKGRTQFVRMMNRLEKRHADGVLLHKIDRGARNLWDWARIQNLLDAGLDVRFVHDNLDMASRGGRLAADIQAVVAADFVRNLREEVRKGIRGRLKQGLYPLSAPLGYQNNGKGKPKTIDPIKGPLVRMAFELYATRQYPFHRLRAELQKRGLTRKDGGPLNLCSMTAMFRNPFYTGIIRLKVTGELYQGVHAPLISPGLFRRVQQILDGRLSQRPNKHDFLYRRLFRCAACGVTLIGERQKGTVYYRCHTPTCATTGIREDAISARFRELISPIRFTNEQVRDLLPMFQAEERLWVASRAERARSAQLRVKALADREHRLTDAFLDQKITHEAYQTRLGPLLLELAEAREAEQRVASEESEFKGRIEGFFDFVKSINFEEGRNATQELRDLLQELTSNCSLAGKTPCITLRSPFQELSAELTFLRCAPHRYSPRTFHPPRSASAHEQDDHSRQIVRALKKHLKDWKPPLHLELMRRKRQPPWPQRSSNNKHQQAA